LQRNFKSSFLQKIKFEKFAKLKTKHLPLQRKKKFFEIKKKKSLQS